MRAGWWSPTITRTRCARRPLDLTDALDAFHEKPLDQVEIDCDLKLPGREAELAGALAGHGMIERAMVSTMEIESLQKLRQLEPDLRLGWTYPKTRRDWTSYGWARLGVGSRPRGDPPPVPRDPRVEGPRARSRCGLGYHLRDHTEAGRGGESAGRRADRLDSGRPRADPTLAEMGVHGICSNDPRLFAVADRVPEKPAKQSRAEKREAKRTAKQAGQGSRRPRRRARDRQAARLRSEERSP